jgi:feruloyl esterase
MPRRHPERIRNRALIAAPLCLAAALTAQAGTAGGRCETLLNRTIGGAKITQAAPIRPDPVWVAPAAPAQSGAHQPFCRVFARIERTIGFELWLPASAQWNGRLLGSGVGGSAGTYNFMGLARGVDRGFATASTDTGHLATDKEWMMDRQAAANYAIRAVHLMTVAAKRIIADYYGHKPAHAYFAGCSGGGREALKELQRYPDDYNGILAGAPGPNMPLLSVRHMLSGLWQQQSGITIEEADWKLVQQQAIKACDALDGLADGVVEDPRRCQVDLQALQCTPDNAGACISPEKLALITRIVAPMSDAAGNPLDSGLFPGVRSRPGPPPSLVAELFGQGAHHDAHWDPTTFDPASDLALAYREQPELRADDPNLAAFRRHGGKAILYQGWMDPSVIAQQSLSYYDRVVSTAGGQAPASQFIRLFMVPGMYHCGGGDSTDRFGGEAGSVSDDPQHDALSALIKWTEKGVAPTQIIASRVVDGQVVRTRPLCPFPAVAHYDGSGAPDLAASFSCVTPSP